MIEPERQRRAEELFHSALRVPASERTAFLRNACADAELREEVESLLAYESSANQFIEKPALEVAAGLLAEVHSGGHDIPEGWADGKLERYRVLEKLGGGGMGVVYKAEDTRLRRTVALKFLPPGLAPDPQALERFQREAHSASALNHPGICTVYDIGEFDGQPFITMEFLDGETLERRINGKPLPLPELIALGLQIADALQAAHTRGIIHRDIKPSNIFITSRSQAKVLDFGLAKLQGSEANDAPPKKEDAPAEDQFVANLTLTRTGVAMGTAGYMSPEQVRGERLDARTDLFSFGLVLYEMATGQRAFAGDAGPVLHDAILNHNPKPVRELNPKLPSRLNQIIQKALQKGRDTRYQSASELRADLEALRQNLEPTRRLWRWTVVAGCIALVSAVALVWLASHRRAAPAAVRLLKQWQVTANSSENHFRSGSISPDGKYVAYSDSTGIHTKVIATGKTTTIPQPEGFGSELPSWEVGSWLADSSGFSVSQDTVIPSLSYWIVSMSGGAPRKIRDDINPWSYSPTGSWLAATMKEDLGSLGGSEIWIMKPDGSQARKIYEADDKSLFRWITWSPDGERVAYVRDRSVSGHHEVTIESRDLRGASRVTMLPSAKLGGFDSLTVGEQAFVWLPDGRVIYAKGEARADCPTNLVEVRVDTHTGALQEEPRQITDWAGFCIFSPSATADGKQLTLLRQTTEVPVYVAEFDSVTGRLSVPSRLTLTEDVSGPVGWTPDNKTVIFFSGREGNWGLYRQGLGRSTSESLVTDLKGSLPIGVSHDWLFYAPTDPSVPPGTPSALMRVPLSGGIPHEVLRGRLSGVGCGWSLRARCVISELTGDKKEIIFTALDPVKGRGPELARFHDDDAESLFWKLSPDGSRVAIVRDLEGRIRVLSLERRTVQQVDIKGGGQLRPFDWAADGKGFFGSIAVQRGAQLTYIDLRGNTRSLWEASGHNALIEPVAAPDGRHVAFSASRQTANLWMLEDF